MGEQMPELDYLQLTSKFLEREFGDIPVGQYFSRLRRFAEIVAKAQRELLKGWRKLPSEEEARAKFIECIKKANEEGAYKGADSSNDARAKVIMAAFVLYHRWLQEEK